MTMVQCVDARRFEAEEDRQTLVEYGLIIGLLSIVAIGAITFLGGTITGLFEDVTTALGGTVPV
ncbi:MAG: Flp family type IVb pilin [Dehalococcoidia bacterium]|nr:MAG: Flp family type IVb pilin [Dehalococcoidia bacterium]